MLAPERPYLPWGSSGDFDRVLHRFVVMVAIAELGLPRTSRLPLMLMWVYLKQLLSNSLVLDTRNR